MIVSYIDSLIDRTTMYRVVLYYLVAILVVAVGLSAFGLLPYSPIGILESTALLLVLCGVANAVFGKAFEAPTNLESTYVTALILACILPPVHSFQDLPLLFWGALLATGSKYILAIRSKHIFNPAAIAVVLTAFWLNQPATWWVGTPLLAPVMLLGGILMVRKLQRTALVVTFLVAALATSAIFTAFGGYSVLQTLLDLLLRSPLLFLGFVMLTEPLTSPPTTLLQTLYGGLVGVLSAPQVHLGSLFFSPELALVAGNAFSYAVSPKGKQKITVNKNCHLTSDLIELDFKPSDPLHFQPGQYMEFTLSHQHQDSRGSRRSFTLASSPTEKTLKLGVKLSENGSSFKKKLFSLTSGQTLMAGQLSGEFTMPKDLSQKLAFIAGGIGVTPFRSVLKYVSDSGEKRSITMLYMNRTADEIAYQDVFNEAQDKADARVVYTLTGQAPDGWAGRTGRVDEQMIREELPDYTERTFYISGPHAMVAATEKVLQKMGVARTMIKKDFFPGLA